MYLRIEGNVKKRPPFGAGRLFKQAHPSFMRKPITLLCITFYARADDVLPSRHSAAVTGHYVVQIEIPLFEQLPAILAGVLVPLEDVVPGELHLLAWHAIEKKQHDDARNANLEGDSVHHLFFLVWRSIRKVAPAVEIVGQKILPIGVDNLRMTSAEETEGPPHAADVDRLPQAVQHEHLAVEDLNHKPELRDEGGRKLVG